MPTFRGLFFRLLGWGALAWGLLLLCRLAFALAHLPTGMSPLPVILQFLYGIPFDLATLPILLLWIWLFLPASCLFQRKDSFYKARFFLEYFQGIWIGLLLLILTSSIYNFGVNSKHFGWEFFAYLKDSVPILSGLFLDSPLLFFLFLALFPAWLFAIPRFLGFFDRIDATDRKKKPATEIKEKEQQERPIQSLAAKTAHTKRKKQTIQAIARRPWLRFFFAELVLLALAIVFLRGGFGMSPLRVADAMRTQSSFLNNIPLNGVLTVAFSLRGEVEFQKYFPVSQNIKYVQGLLDSPEAFLDPQYPLLRKMPYKNTARHLFGIKRKPNIVLFILESYTAKFLQIHGGDPRIAPNLNRLIQQGIYFRRFMASGGRSANGLYSMFAGIPDRAGRTILRSPQINQPYGGLPALLAQKGYQSLFLHGGKLEFDNLNTVLPHLGFQKLIGYQALKQSGLYARPTPWGFDDKDSFDYLRRSLSKMQEPFFAAIFTVNTHHPYIQSQDPKLRIFSGKTPDERYLNSYHYTDAIIGNFFNKVRKEPWFSHTVFLLTADHAHHRHLNYLEDRNIPFLVYVPGPKRAQVRTELHSQVDVLPSILSLAGGDSPYAGLGRDMLNPAPSIRKKGAFAFYAGGSGTNLIGLVKGDYLLVHSLDIKQQFLLKGRFPALERDLSREHPKITQQMLKQSLHIQQFVRYLEEENRIWPQKKGK